MKLFTPYQNKRKTLFDDYSSTIFSDIVHIMHSILKQWNPKAVHIYFFKTTCNTWYVQFSQRVISVEQ